MDINRQEDEAISLGVDPSDYRRHKIAYTTEIMEKLGPAIGPARPLFELSKDPPSWHHGCRISPQLAANQWESWLEQLPDDEAKPPANPFLTPRELDLVSKISTIVSQMTREELRALGTHAGARDTIRAIEFNRNLWEGDFSKLLADVRQEQVHRLIGASDRLKYVAQEIKRKAMTNQTDYASALVKLRAALDAIGDAALRASIEKVQSFDTAQIWGNPTVQRYAEHAEEFVALSDCLRILSEALSSRKPLDEENRGALTKALPILRGLGTFSDGLLKQSQKGELDCTLVAEECGSMKDRLWGYLPPPSQTRKTGVPGAG